jgi:flagellar hook protein FlgE
MGSFAIPLSGLLASQEDLGVISNNLANMNTTGFKGSTASFSNLIYQQLGSDGAGDPIQTGLGTQVGSTSTNFTEGSIQNTGVDTNVAIQGNGFLQVQNNGVTQYTRDGDLSLNTNGNLVASDGSEVMGYAAVNGVVNASGSLVPLQINLGQTTPPQATANVGIDLNLDANAGVAASQQTGTGIPAGTTLATGSTITFNDAAAGPNSFTYTTAAGDTLQTIVNQINASGNFTASLSGNSLVITANSGTPISFTANTLADAGGDAESFAASGQGSYSTPVTAYDSLGNSHVLTFNFDKTASNTWNYQISIPGSDVTPASSSPVVLSSGTLTFNPNGTLKSPTSNVAGITLPAGDTMADGAKNLNFSWDLVNGSNTPVVSQVAGASVASGTQQDGYAAGTLQTFTIQQDGTIQGSFSNGQVSSLGQIALANLPNQEGLLQTGNGNYVATLASGLPSVGVPGTGGLGTLQGGALEGSNVDISTEFSNLILAQQSYEANARAFNIESGIFTNSTLQLGIGQ